MKKKETIIITYSCFGKFLRMEYEKKQLLIDYGHYIIMEQMCDRKPKTVKQILQERLCEYLSILLTSENNTLHYRY